MSYYFELGADVSSVHEWTYLEGTREFLQGFLDNPKGGTWSYENGTLILTNRETQLPRKALLQGYSTKREDKESRGKFGDGLASGICALLNEGHEILIENGDVTWVPVIKYSETFEHDVVMIEEYMTEYPNEDYIVYIKGITETQMQKITNNTLSLQGDYGDVHSTSQGEILLHEAHKGRIYVGGLFVDYFKSDYGFNFKPHCFDLDRDRKSLKPFDIQYKAKDMWGEISDSADEDVSEEIVSALVKGENSMEYAKYTLNTNNKNIQNSAEKVYNEKYSGKLVTSDYDECEQLRMAGNEVVHVKSEGLVKIIRETEAYQTVKLGQKKVKTITEILEDWKQEWYDSFETEMLYSYEDMQTLIQNSHKTK
ncbi:putative histidine kinase-like ATPase [Vibrio phage 277E43-1]|nr:putative histidine kinase-like ATPase [Vibrio phage 277E43-1]